MSAASIRQHSDYATPRAIRASRNEREPSLEKILLIQSEYMFVSITGFAYLKPGRRGCAIPISSLSYFSSCFGEYTTCTGTKNRSQEQCDIASTEAEKKKKKSEKSGI